MDKLYLTILNLCSWDDENLHSGICCPIGPGSSMFLSDSLVLRSLGSIPCEIDTCRSETLSPSVLTSLGEILH